MKTNNSQENENLWKRFEGRESIKNKNGNVGTSVTRFSNANQPRLIIMAI